MLRRSPLTLLRGSPASFFTRQYWGACFGATPWASSKTTGSVHPPPDNGGFAVCQFCCCLLSKSENIAAEGAEEAPLASSNGAGCGGIVML
eukprot:CAMPEP_0174368270 /NCGR_PEP_ID=MMETSP0811_2-20130205/88471_1 /TAXON_ID=73025 ORGANISM="Eutreptiella gymnastica-like, Strain CCMP1594" /NCGR_SAMPLE_ID=MMETSP0811_2 /ASSEMBLY_ACC=CAM_ASM_000667 /LENGTH=90 /DNA_ID=CAMNT_0015511627 /DNA_START=210 /DNA_END=482 /DNA_ORIENTATION=-